MVEPGRSYSAGNQYRYGFNGKEKNKDITSDNYDFGARIYDGRIGKWSGKATIIIMFPYLCVTIMESQNIGTMLNHVAQLRLQ